MTKRGLAAIAALALLPGLLVGCSVSDEDSNSKDNSPARGTSNDQDPSDPLGIFSEEELSAELSQTYTGDKFGVSFKYSKGLQIDSDNNVWKGGVDLASPKGLVRFSVSTGGLGWGTIAEARSAMETSGLEVTDLEVSGYPALRAKRNDTPEFPGGITYVVWRGVEDYITVRLDVPPMDQVGRFEDVSDAMVQTFEIGPLPDSPTGY
ncbi:MAG: DUF3558 domain-containing protein [Bifidobacteriaceae bacterium]|jgi:hypothetical protein|nr:DUF3558 domain-containing protein [Bifidobacteriaceae bacterium]